MPLLLLLLLLFTLLRQRAKPLFTRKKKIHNVCSNLKGSQHAARNQYQEPDIHVEELGDFISHVDWENQQKETHAEATEVFPHTPAGRDGAQVKTTIQEGPSGWNFNPPWLKLPVPGGTQGQDDRIRYFNHELQSRSDHDEEDDAEEEGTLWHLHVQQARLESEQQQCDTLGHTSGWPGQDRAHFVFVFAFLTAHFQIIYLSLCYIRLHLSNWMSSTLLYMMQHYSKIKSDTHTHTPVSFRNCFAQS